MKKIKKREKKKIKPNKKPKKRNKVIYPYPKKYFKLTKNKNANIFNFSKFQIYFFKMKDLIFLFRLIYLKDY